MKSIAVCLALSFAVVRLNAQAEFVFTIDPVGRWEYDTFRDDNPDLKIHAIFRFLGDTLMPNGHSYSPFSAGSNPVFFLRESGSQVFSYNPIDSSEFLWCDPSKKVGDTIAIVSREYTHTNLVFVSEDTASVLGERRWVRSFASDDRGTVYSLADSVGIIAFVLGMHFVYELTGAVVGGQTYGVITGVHDPRSSNPSPNHFDLAFTYPNPFNSSTIITYRFSVETKASVTIVNGLGQTVATLIDQTMSPGIHTVRWTAGGLPSGIYYVVLRSGDYTRARSILLLR